MNDLPIALISQAGGLLAILAVIWWRANATDKAMEKVDKRFDKIDGEIEKANEKIEAVRLKQIEMNGHTTERLENRVDEIGRNMHGLRNELTGLLVRLTAKDLEGRDKP